MSRIFFPAVNLKQVSEKYSTGAFSNKSWPVGNTSTDLVKDKSITIKPTLMYADTSKEQFIEFTNLGTKTMTMINHTVNYQGAYNRAVVKNKKVRCMYCLWEFDVCEEAPLGIPIAMQQLDDGRMSYYTVDIFCSFPCMLAECQVRHKSNDALYSCSINFIHQMWAGMTGKKSNELRPAPDKRLLNIFNGTMTYDQFRKNIGKYSSNTSISVLVPVLQYIEKDAVN